MSKKPIGYNNVAEWIGDNLSVAGQHFQDYFAQKSGSKAKNVWHGQHFEWFASRVQRDRFTEVDVAAIGALSVDLRAQTARELIEDRDNLLRPLLQECELWVAAHGADASDSNLSEEWLEKNSCFQKLWYELVKPERIGLGSVKASKLMAAKYAGLIPIYDSQVAWLLGLSKNDPWWKPLRDLAIELKPLLDGEMFVLNRDDIKVSTVRKLDVVLWMEANKRLGNS